MSYPPIDPHDAGTLPAAHGAQLWWETSGSPDGVPVIWLHGGPGSGLGEGCRRRLDPDRWRVVGNDQRACGRSRPLATAPGFDLGTLTPQQDIADLELLRQHLGIDRGPRWRRHGAALEAAYDAMVQPG